MEIFISQDKICTEFACGARVLDYPLMVRRDEDFVPLSDYRVTEEDTETIVFLIRRWYGWSEMVIPFNYKSATLSFLRMFHNTPQLDFDCYSFATLAAGLPMHDKKYLHAFWQVNSLNRSVIAGHKIIFLINEKSQGFAHAALHIGSGYFLSVQGAGGQLSVSLLDDLRKAYKDFPDIWEVTPK